MSYKWTCTSRLSENTERSQAQQEQWQWAFMWIVPTLVVTALALSAIALSTDWDLRLADLAFDSGSKTFPLRHAWATAIFNHVILKRLFTGLGVVLLLTVAWDLVSPRPWSWLRRFQLRVSALSAIAIPAVISFAKFHSDSHCPWDLAAMEGPNLMCACSTACPQGSALDTACRPGTLPAHFG